MELETIALALSVLIIVILLMNMAKQRKQMSGRLSTAPQRTSRPQKCSSSQWQNSMSVPKTSKSPEDDEFFADYGTGVTNRQLASQYKKLKDLQQYDDYNQVLQYSSLEPEVFESHELYAQDMNRTTTGASNMSIRSDDNYPIKWIGLRRPDMHSAYADSTARQEQSEAPESMPAQTRYLL